MKWQNLSKITIIVIFSLAVILIQKRRDLQVVGL